jgi:hypothetical protein
VRSAGRFSSRAVDGLPAVRADVGPVDIDMPATSQAGFAQMTGRVAHEQSLGVLPRSSPHPGETWRAMPVTGILGVVTAQLGVAVLFGAGSIFLGRFGLLPCVVGDSANEGWGLGCHDFLKYPCRMSVKPAIRFGRGGSG